MPMNGPCSAFRRYTNRFGDLRLVVCRIESTPEQQLASWLFVRWLLSPQIQQKWVEVTGLFPLRTSALDLLSGYKDSHPQWSAAIGLLPQAQIEPQAGFVA